MFHSRSDIFSRGWLEIVFAGRNQQYGAYLLRKESAGDLRKSLLIGTSLFIFIAIMPIIARHLQGAPPAMLQTDRTVRVIDLLPPKSVDPTTPPPPVAPPPPRKDMVRMPPPVIVPHNLVNDVEPPTIAELQKADPGPQTIAGNPDADIRIDADYGKGDMNNQLTESSGAADDPFITVEVSPMFPGGLAKFGEYISRNFQYPSQAIDQNIRGKVHVQFVVERDGSLTDIKILRDLGYGTGDEAVRILKASPKWKPGIQNGRAVRVMYTLPISLDVSLR